MKTTGIIIDGVYYKDTNLTVGDLKDARAVTDKQYEHDRQREQHQVDLIQPRLSDGTPNPEFITHYREESKVYGFIKE